MGRKRAAGGGKRPGAHRGAVHGYHTLVGRDANDEVIREMLERRDPSAIELAYDLWAAEVFAIALCMLDQTSAEDVVAAVFLDLWRLPMGAVATHRSLGGYLCAFAFSEASVRSVGSTSRRDSTRFQYSGSSRHSNHFPTKAL